MTTDQQTAVKTCPRCGIKLRAIASRRIGESQQRRLECRVCKHRETVIVPAAQVWRRGQ